MSTLPTYLSPQVLDLLLLLFDHPSQLLELLSQRDVHQCLFLVETLPHQLQKFLLALGQLLISLEGLPFSHFQLFLQELLIRVQAFSLLIESPDYLTHSLLWF